MRTRTRFILILTGCAPAFGVGADTGSEAQVAGMHHGLFLGFSNLGTNPQSALGQLDPQNRLTTLVSQANSPWPYGGHVWGATMYVDNETVLVHGLICLTKGRDPFFGQGSAKRAEPVRAGGGASSVVVGDATPAPNRKEQEDARLLTYRFRTHPDPGREFRDRTEAQRR